VKSEEKELSREEFVEVVNEEKEKQKANRRSISEVIKDTRAFLSFYRIGAYGLLVLAFSISIAMTIFISLLTSSH